MRALNRKAAAAPSCLDAHDHTAQEWSDLDPVCKKSVRAALEQMQIYSAASVVCCAYCEGKITRSDPHSEKNIDSHLEHFRRKRHHPELTFAWDNLFLSCNSSDHCGHYKDRKTAASYDPDNLIKPDTDKPELFLHFLSSGKVVVRDGLSPKDQRRAEATIEVFGLNAKELARQRRSAVKKYRSGEYLDELNEIKEIDHIQIEDIQRHLEEEIERMREFPYFTTIKHTILNLL